MLFLVAWTQSWPGKRSVCPWMVRLRTIDLQSRNPGILQVVQAEALEFLDLSRVTCRSLSGTHSCRLARLDAPCGPVTPTMVRPDVIETEAHEVILQTLARQTIQMVPAFRQSDADSEIEMTHNLIRDCRKTWHRSGWARTVSAGDYTVRSLAARQLWEGGRLDGRESRRFGATLMGTIWGRLPAFRHRYGWISTI